MSNKAIDAYIKEFHNNGKKEYNMYLHYNGVEFTFLYKHPEERTFAQVFTSKLAERHNTSVFTFTDDHGYTTAENDSNAILAAVHGAKNISEAIAPLVSTCLNLDIESDLHIHTPNGQSYKLVGDADEIEFPASSMANKGYSITALQNLSTDLANIESKSK